jgi:hypothetical protein
MSCEHGNWKDCELCDAENEAYNRGYRDAGIEYIKEMAAVTKERDALREAAQRIYADTLLEGQSAEHYKRIMLVWRDWLNTATKRE